MKTDEKDAINIEKIVKKWVKERKLSGLNSQEDKSLIQWGLQFVDRIFAERQNIDTKKKGSSAEQHDLPDLPSTDMKDIRYNADDIGDVYSG